MASVGTFAPPAPKRGGFTGKLESFGNSIWDSQTKQFLGRTGLSWGKIGLFYLIFYACLGAFFAMCLELFKLTRSEDYPKLINEESLLGENPGLGFRPMPDYQTTLIRFEQGIASSYKPYTDQLQAVLEQYDPARISGDELDDCTGDDRPQRTSVCKFDTQRVLGDVCTRQKDFGYDLGKPCVMIKLNKIFGWEPVMNKKAGVNGTKSEAEEMLKERFDENYVGVTCHGENPADKEYIGELEYFPKQGFHKKFFPFLNQRGYRQPLVFVKFTNPKEGQVIQVTCRIWAQNIANKDRLIDSVHRQGSVHFELLVD